jgi:Protein of unknown function (DUF998)
MGKVNLNSDTSKISVSAAYLAIVSAGLVILLLACLHILSPEFDPMRRMVSEYALSNYSWVLSLMFIGWAIGCWSLAFVLWSQVKTIGGKVGLFFLIASGVGAAMASVFDVRHPLHGPAALIGIPTLPIAAILIALSLRRVRNWSSARTALLWTAIFTWLGFILLTVAIIVMLSGLSKTKGEMTPEVVALAGYPNRFLIIIYQVWLMTAAWQAIRLRNASPPTLQLPLKHPSV